MPAHRPRGVEHGCQHPEQPLHPGSTRRGAQSLLSLVPASPAPAPAGFYGNSGGKHGFQQGQRQPRAAQTQRLSCPITGFTRGTPAPGLAQEGRDPSPQPLSPRGQPGCGQGDGVLAARMVLVARSSEMGATARWAPQHGLGVLGLLPPGRLQPRQPEDDRFCARHVTFSRRSRILMSRPPPLQEPLILVLARGGRWGWASPSHGSCPARSEGSSRGAMRGSLILSRQCRGQEGLVQTGAGQELSFSARKHQRGSGEGTSAAAHTDTARCVCMCSHTRVLRGCAPQDQPYWERRCGEQLSQLLPGAQPRGRAAGHAAGRAAGHAAGHAAGRAAGHAAGRAAGHAAGHAAGCTAGCTARCRRS